MECLPDMACAYANVVSMAFSANLLATALASIYNNFDDQDEVMRKRVRAYKDDSRLQEEISINKLADTIERWGTCRRRFWWFGVRVAVLSAIALYLLPWLVPLDLQIVGWWFAALIFASFCGPACFVLMVLAGMRGHKRADERCEELDNQITEAEKNKKKREAAHAEASRRLEERTTKSPPWATNKP